MPKTMPTHVRAIFQYDGSTDILELPNYVPALHTAGYAALPSPEEFFGVSDDVRTCINEIVDVENETEAMNTCARALSTFPRNAIVMLAVSRCMFDVRMAFATIAAVRELAAGMLRSPEAATYADEEILAIAMAGFPELVEVFMAMQADDDVVPALIAAIQLVPRNTPLFIHTVIQYGAVYDSPQMRGKGAGASYRVFRKLAADNLQTFPCNETCLLLADLVHTCMNTTTQTKRANDLLDRLRASYLDEMSADLIRQYRAMNLGLDDLMDLVESTMLPYDVPPE